MASAKKKTAKAEPKAAKQAATPKKSTAAMQSQAAKRPAATKSIQAKGKKPVAAAPVKEVKGKKKEGKLESLKNLLLGSKSAPKTSEVKGKKAPAAVATKVTTAKAAVAPKAEAKIAKPAPVGKLGAKGKARGTVIEVQTKKAAGLTGRRSAHHDPVCRESGCESLSTTATYCRLHYIKNWKKIKRKELILKERKLNQYIEELVAKYPDKYIEAIRQDLANDKEFNKVIHDLELDENIDDFEGESSEAAEAIIDNIKRDFDDEGDAF